MVYPLTSNCELLFLCTGFYERHLELPCVSLLPPLNVLRNS